MRAVASISRYIVGILFIFSGLIKLNDPVGTQIKLEEYFEVFAQDMPAMHDFFIGLIPFALYLSVFLCTLEVVLGVALLVKYKPRVTALLLLVTILFFTFLTFYSAWFNKVTDCGCFGDAIKLTPWTSFGKDIFLLILIILILLGIKFIKPAKTGLVVIISTVISLGISFYAIRHLPVLDLLPYKIGNSIPAQMQPSEPLRYQYIFDKAGKTVKFEQYPSDTTLEFKEMQIINKDALPKITDYRIWNEEGDFTDSTFIGSKLILIIKNLKDINAAAFPEIRTLLEQLDGIDVTPIIVTSASSKDIEQLLAQQQIGLPYYFADATVLKTIVRSNPGLILLNDGVVKGKWHYNDTPLAGELKNKLQRNN